MAHEPKSLKCSPDGTAVAIRTQFAEDGPFAHMAWLIATFNAGAQPARSSDVADWPDLPRPGGSDTPAAET